MTDAITSFSGEYFFLSNFYPRVFFWVHPIYGRRSGNSSEHHFQAAKAGDMDDWLYVYRGQTASGAKIRGRHIKKRPDWDSIKVDVMTSVVRAKFQEPVMQKMLLATGDAELVEGNDWGDTFWGESPLGIGQNHLGKILMQIRQELRST